jgi:hypothetical protein
MSASPDNAEYARILADLRRVAGHQRTLAGQLDALTALRDELIVEASRLGLSRRTVAASAGVTNPRVQQIVDRDARAPDPGATRRPDPVEDRLRRILGEGEPPAG